MIEALVISNVLLWVVVLVLAAIVVALARQVGVLHERVAPVGALATAEGPAVGDAAPQFDLVDVEGREWSLGGAREAATLLFFVSPTCPVCKTLLPTVERVVGREGAVSLMLASDGPIEEHRSFVQKHALDRFPYILSTELGRAFQVAKLPYAVLIDEAGVVRAKGIVNTREHVESLFAASGLGVASIQEYLDQRTSRAEAV
ncbi:MAG: methylamine dehydrogenase accessory protein MauD [Candidatus Binatia bacterium]|nr:methylamine dehydrogenase accessory protein MauD [Candidatus Binatia bacterium]